MHPQTLREVMMENDFRDDDQPDSSEQARSLNQDERSATPMGGGRRAIKQGDIYWVPIDTSSEAQQDHQHPHVVIQDNVLNRSLITTLVVCALTSNLKRAKAPGNVLLEVGEANLAKQSVVVVSQVATVEKARLGEYIGSLTQERINQILAGMRFVQVFTEHEGQHSGQ